MDAELRGVRRRAAEAALDAAESEDELSGDETDGEPEKV